MATLWKEVTKSFSLNMSERLRLAQLKNLLPFSNRELQSISDEDVSFIACTLAMMINNFSEKMGLDKQKTQKIDSRAGLLNMKGDLIVLQRYIERIFITDIAKNVIIPFLKNNKREALQDEITVDITPDEYTRLVAYVQRLENAGFSQPEIEDFFSLIQRIPNNA